MSTRAPRAIVRGLACALIGAATAVRAGPEVGQPAPALVVRRLDERSFDLAALRGHVVLVNVWATWCGPCRAEMPALNAFYARHHAAGLELLGLSIDDRRDLGEVRKVMQRFAYPAALAAGATRNGFGDPFAVPITYVIDRAGVLRARLLPRGNGGLSEQELEQAVSPLLAAAARPAT